MDPDDPKRMDKIREYAAIYGRFDCKRKAEKPLTLHEVRWSVQDALHLALLEINVHPQLWSLWPADMHYFEYT